MAQAYGASVQVDKALAYVDLQGSSVHASMLERIGVLTREEHSLIQRGLDQILELIENDRMDWDNTLEDVHMNIESKLKSLIGDAASKLHTARSRNDQVATDLRLYARQESGQIQDLLVEMLDTLVSLASKHLDVIMPGYTHMQRAQPVRFSHHLLAWCEMLARDHGRIEDAILRMNENPLGAAALATTTFPIDRWFTAKALGFHRPMRNSIDAVSARDHIMELQSAFAILAVHLSRISEELVLWSTQEFGFIQMSDAFTTGSSIMPQKKNPDMAELARGKSARVVGNAVQSLVLMKSLPLAYNRDMQEDKHAFFDSLETIQMTLSVLTPSLATMRVNPEAMREATEKGFINATELADFLVTKGVPFREAHHVMGAIVLECTQKNITLQQLDLAGYKRHHNAFDAMLYKALDMDTAVEKRNVYGGPSKAQVKAQLSEWKHWLKRFKSTAP